MRPTQNYTSARQGKAELRNRAHEKPPQHNSILKGPPTPVLDRRLYVCTAMRFSAAHVVCNRPPSVQPPVKSIRNLKPPPKSGPPARKTNDRFRSRVPHFRINPTRGRMYCTAFEKHLLPIHVVYNELPAVCRVQPPVKPSILNITARYAGTS